MKLTKKAWDIAHRVHKGQKYGEKDYALYHVEGVRAELMNNYVEYFGSAALNVGNWGELEIREVVETSTILHDTVEDSDPKDAIATLIKDQFPIMVYEIVMALTKPKGMEYADYILSMLDTGSISVGVRAIKRADLKFNISHNGPGARKSKYLLAHYILSNKL